MKNILDLHLPLTHACRAGRTTTTATATCPARGTFSELDRCIARIAADLVMIGQSGPADITVWPFAIAASEVGVGGTGQWSLRSATTRVRDEDRARLDCMAVSWIEVFFV